MKSDQMTIANKRVKTGTSRSESFKMQHKAQKEVFVNGGVGFYDTIKNQIIRKGIQEGNVTDGEIEIDVDDLDFGMGL